MRDCAMKRCGRNATTTRTDAPRDNPLHMLCDFLCDRFTLSLCVCVLCVGCMIVLRATITDADRDDRFFQHPVAQCVYDIAFFGELTCLSACVH